MEKTRDQRISAERNRLNRILGATKRKDGLEPTPKIKAAKGLIENAAFMAVHLQDLQAEMNEHGCVEEYRNGENQYGMKKSAAADMYTTMYKNYIATIKQLADLAPDNVETDELSLFMRDGGP
jgi:hypothetical protein